MTTSQVSEKALPESKKRSKAAKGTVKIESDKGWLRLRFSVAGKRYAFAVGLPDTLLNRKVVQAKAQQIELDIISGNFDPTLTKYKPEKLSQESKADLLTIPSFFESFMEYKAKEVCSKTMEKYRATYNYLLKFFCDQPVNFLDEAVTEKFMNWQFSQGLSPDQVKRRMEELEACWRWHKAENNPWEKMGKRIKVPPKQRPKPFSREEINTIIEGFRTDRYYCSYADFVEFLFGTGCRIGEVIGLRWQHISDDCSQIWIGEQLTRGKRKAAKRNRARTITLTAKLQNLLIRRKQSNPDPDSLVFTSPKGGAINDHNFRNRAWKKTLTRLGIDYRKPYNTRHTLISHALDLQMNPVMVAQLTGHDVKTLYENYAGNVNSRPTLPEL
ncbi:integrase family protein [Gloeothece citriformis PCC 7424]|uniref:Integrase family protein n=1 Tax=Gloeothece citriformis (strain PCC 7424) TaxID=65393 RepID=B7KK29_GLOC7|nr:site-specific integrase [Gloeothece citriformis]ACK70914.1 integrase family protein [Gloeothece citriformis PCC 7424]